jgi:hypothetical protein
MEEKAGGKIDSIDKQTKSFWRGHQRESRVTRGNRRMEGSLAEDKAKQPPKRGACIHLPFEPSSVKMIVWSCLFVLAL